MTTARLRARLVNHHQRPAPARPRYPAPGCFPMQHLLNHVVTGRTLSVDQAIEAFELIMTGQATAAQVGALLAMMQQRQPTVDEIIGAARVMREKVAAVEVPAGLSIIDTCGTGGDHTPTFNISTAAAIVAAAAGRPRNVAVAKHGNRTVTRSSGSSQGLEALGVKLQVSGQTLTRCLDEAGICFCFAPAHHPAMKHAMPVRMELGMRTIFNVLGPLTNPAGAERQVLGVFDSAMTEPLADVLKNLGAQTAIVCHGKKLPDGSDSGFCEVSVCGPTRISRLKNGSVVTSTINPGELGVEVSKVEALLVDDPQHSAQVISSVFAGEKGPPRDAVCVNAAAALIVADLADGFDEAIDAAAGAIESGAAAAALAKLVELTQSDTSADG